MQLANLFSPVLLVVYCFSVKQHHEQRIPLRYLADLDCTHIQGQTDNAYSDLS